MLQEYYYWLLEHDHLMRRNFEIRGTKQLKRMFAYARKSTKMPDFMSPDNVEQLRKYWESPDFKKLSEQNKKKTAITTKTALDYHYTPVVQFP